MKAVDQQTNPIPVFGVQFKSEYFKVEPGVWLKVMQWHPKHPISNKSIVFVAGWVSNIKGWIPLLKDLIKKYPVYYVETREKISACINHTHTTQTDFSISRMAKDLIQVCRQIPAPMNDIVMIACSLGATALLEALKQDRLKLSAAFLIAPNSEFTAPGSVTWILSLPSGLYHVIKYFILWYLKTFRVDAQKEPEQMQRYTDTLLAAHPRRIQLSARSAILDKYQVWPDLETIGTPVAIAFAPTDTLHSETSIKRMVQAIKQANLIHCPSNKYMHSADLIFDIERFFKNTELLSK